MSDPISVLCCALRLRAVAMVMLSMVLLGGCVRRTLRVTSDPPGALVWLNDREVGRTPVEVDFTFYGDYDVRLVHEGYEPLWAIGKARAPLWDTVPFDLAAEAMPGKPHAQIEWHYTLTPRDDDPDRLLERADELRTRVAQ
ncbi:MAG: PEGA domain-containing protein [Phycisphaerales bacterium]